MYTYPPVTHHIPTACLSLACGVGQIIREKARETLSMLMTMLRTVGGNAHNAKVCEMCLPNEISMGLPVSSAHRAWFLMWSCTH